MAEMTPITPDMQPVASTGDGAPYIAERFRDAAPSAPAKAANYTFAGICAIVAFIVFAITLAILFQDWNFLQSA